MIRNNVILLFTLMVSTLHAEQPVNQEPTIDELKGELERLQLIDQIHNLQKKMAKQDIANEIEVREIEKTRLKQKMDLEKLQVQYEQFQKILDAERTHFENLYEKEKASHDIIQKQYKNDLLAQELRFKEIMASTNQFELDLLRNKQAMSKVIEGKVERLRNPYDKVNNKLILSDRVIHLNGPITYDTAEMISNEVNFYNNQSDYPIFIVIDSSPGGSLAAGINILSTIESSNADIHVVLKTYAASMAAAIVTLAPQSYAYPNATILHHQASSYLFGFFNMNVTEQKELAESTEKKFKKIAEPIAKKMGTSVKQFVQMMYENNSNGDWWMHADEAVKYKWVDNIIHEIKETGIIDLDDTLTQKKCDKHEYNNYSLPQLNYFDCYFLYDPQGRYKVAGNET